jgi:hypothetical protein
LILADCFESFRELSLKHYGLDPAHYISSPGLSWDAMLKYTGIELELLTDQDMLLMIMEGMHLCRLIIHRNQCIRYSNTLLTLK